MIHAERTEDPLFDQVIPAFLRDALAQEPGDHRARVAVRASGAWCVKLRYLREARDGSLDGFTVVTGVRQQIAADAGGVIHQLLDRDGARRFRVAEFEAGQILDHPSL